METIQILHVVPRPHDVLSFSELVCGEPVPGIRELDDELVEFRARKQAHRAQEPFSTAKLQRSTTEDDEIKTKRKHAEEIPEHGPKMRRELCLEISRPQKNHILPAKIIGGYSLCG